MKRSNRKLKRAFTITELVIVIAVIAILAAVLIPGFTYVVNRARKSTALQEATNTYKEITAVMLFNNGMELEDGTLFSDEEGEFFFVLENGSLTYTETPEMNGKNATIFDGCVMYATVGMTGTDADGEYLDSSRNTWCTDSDKKNEVLINFQTSGNTKYSVTVYDEDGNEWYSEGGTAGSDGIKNGVRFYTVNGNNAWAQDATVSAALQATTDRDGAVGWYSYAVTIGDNTYYGAYYLS